MRVLQIGAGRWGRNHVRSWQRLGANLCLFDLDPAACAPFDVPTAASIDAALGSVDAVDVVTPSSTHAALVRQAIEAGKDVFVEKPLTPRADEAFELDALARERNAILQVGHVFRFSPEAGGLKRLLEAGHIGLPTYASGQFGGFKRPRADGGAAISDGIHWIDLASWLLGAQPRAVQATLRAMGRLKASLRLRRREDDGDESEDDEDGGAALPALEWSDDDEREGEGEGEGEGGGGAEGPPKPPVVRTY
ncbi:MAG: Gfo/Idh/MocA family oxidoreductase, partial [Myxococcota bacterium]|nr:Gfo/Idh/MocA family oxidoreductase [Myxococcota bacterium]